MQAIVTRLLGASAPNTVDGTKYGAAAVAATAAVLFKNSRLDKPEDSIAFWRFMRKLL
jgi:hypothetical protein